MKRTLFYVLLCLLPFFGLGHPARAQEATFDVTVNRVMVDFPATVTFRLSAATDGKITGAALIYGTNARSCREGAARRTMDFTPARQVSLTWEWDLERSGALPPGAEIWWEWELRDAAGNTWRTPRQTAVVNDTAYTWQTRSRGQITVQWVEGDASFGNAMLDIASRSLDRLVNQMGIAPASPILITIYPDVDSVRRALIHSAEWTGGVAFPAYNSIIVGFAPEATDWAREVLPHELGHLVVGTLTFNCKGISLPTWLDEGLAVYAEGPVSEADTERLQTALENGTLPPLTALATGFSPYPEEAARAYAHSGAVVGYLVETYGPEKLNAFLRYIQEGHKADAALQTIYGLDTYGLDRAWRSSWGYADQLPERANTPEAMTATPVPTLALWNPIEATMTPTSGATALPEVSSTPTGTPRRTAPPTKGAPTPQSGSPPKGGPAPLLLIGAVFLFGVIFIILVISRLERS